MANRKTKLELTWIGKDSRPKLESRILLEDPALSYHASHRVEEEDIFSNRLIHGDNLLALKALEQEFSGCVQCVVIDPPYNTGAAFEHYDDGVEHSIWLGLMRDRLELLKELLAPTGSIWITIDDTEAHYLKVMCDEVFGRQSFLGNVIWEKADSPRMDAEYFSVRHDHVLAYAKDRSSTRWNRLVIGEDGVAGHYDKTDDKGRRYYLKPLRAMGGQGDSRAARPTLYFPLTAPDGTQVLPRRQDGTDGAWRWNPKKIHQEHDRIDWISGRNGWNPYYRIYADTSDGRPPETVWPHEEVGSNRTSKAEIKALFPDQTPFGTPKPERLIQRIISIATDPGDLVLDSFAGSGTTGAVAHKMRRQWIMVELGDHAVTHVAPRLQKVIDGQDPGGVTDATDWKGGGGFRFYRLAPSLLEKDKWSQWVVSRKYNAAMLAEAVCKLHGFRYDPSPTVFWQHGRSTERDYIYVTTQTLLHEQLAALSEEVGPERTLLVVCSAFRTKRDAFPNLTIKKIPASVLTSCEWGRDDYSLNVANVMRAEEPPPSARPPAAKRGKKAENGAQPRLPGLGGDT